MPMTNLLDSFAAPANLGLPAIVVRGGFAGVAAAIAPSLIPPLIISIVAAIIIAVVVTQPS